MLTTKTIANLTKSLNWAAERQKILAHNLANADTPNYKRRDLDFPQELRESMNKLPLARTHPRHLTGQERPAGFTQPEWGMVRIDRNNVDKEVEMVKSTQNVLYYQSLTQQLSGQFRRLKTAIGGRS
ncbi:MAG: flagellar basal body rod protein FlgB [Firmicutes bacterium]|nr:flagellar basal body rod protein FlgB [Bacillota bacterium]